MRSKARRAADLRAVNSEPSLTPLGALRYSASERGKAAAYTAAKKPFFLTNTSGGFPALGKLAAGVIRLGATHRAAQVHPRFHDSG